ncbi:MAG TPA: IS1182 family transposase [Bryobacteraceae bacterium]|jgi:transposase|nr:IS1182 family transposase [Bryobacteraceae bacterium]
MDLSSQPILLDIPEQPAPESAPAPRGPAKLRTVNRQQTTFGILYVEELIPADHKARAIWDLTGRLDLSGFTEALRTAQGCAGRPAWDPRLLVSLWVYAYSEGIGSAREVERVMQWERGMQWLAGLEAVHHHTLSDFRVDHRKALDELFAQLLALLETEGLVNLEQVMHDGTKIRAQAGADSFRREKTIQERLPQARQAVAQMGDPEAPAPAKDRQKAAQERAARERAARLEAAQQELQALQAAEKTEKEKAEVRVSLTEPEARKMKHGDNAIAPSYNAQISTEAEHKIIVGAHLSQCSSDAHSLMPALEEVEQNLEKKPEQVVVDGGFTNRDSIMQCAAEGIDLVGSLPDPKERSAAAMKALGIDPAFAPSQFRILDHGERLECPAGCSLERLRENYKRGDLYQQYQARGEDCRECRYQPQCCPKSPQRGRTVSIRIEEQEDVAAFRQKMETEESRAVYRRRGEVAEFPNAWIKDKLGLRKFHVRGLVKAGSELLWACLTYNIMQWERLKWRQPKVA